MKVPYIQHYSFEQKNKTMDTTKIDKKKAEFTALTPEHTRTAATFPL